MRCFSLLLIMIMILAVCICGCSTPSPAPLPTTSSPAVSTPAPVPGTWTFVVFGDTRDPAKNTTTGISPELNRIATAVAAEKPDFVLFNGDLIYGGLLTNASPMYNNFSGQFGYWMNAVSPLHNYTTGTGVPIYVIRGNHEDSYTNPAPIIDAYRASVASTMPVNGPPGEERLTYSFTHNGAKFIGLDDYVPHNGIKETVNQTWLDTQLREDTRPFMFVFGHSPGYNVANDPEDGNFSIAIHPTQRDAFWKSLVDNHVPAYFCGHFHMYVRGQAQGIQQIVAGNGGAPAVDFIPADVEPPLTLEYPRMAVPMNESVVGYLVVTVHEDSKTFDGVQKVYNPKTGSWETGDTFTYKAR